MIFVQLPIKIQVFYAPELARPLQMSVCTLTEITIMFQTVEGCTKKTACH